MILDVKLIERKIKTIVFPTLFISLLANSVIRKLRHLDIQLYYYCCIQDLLQHNQFLKYEYQKYSHIRLQRSG